LYSQSAGLHSEAVLTLTGDGVRSSRMPVLVPARARAQPVTPPSLDCREARTAAHPDPLWIGLLMDSTHPGPAGERPDPRTAFAELSKIMLAAQPLTQTIARVAELAQQTIPGAGDVSVTLLQQEHVSTVAFSGTLAAYLDERQYDAGFGPCVDAALSGTVITIPDTAHSPTYPDFGRVAARHGITHTMPIGLPIPERTVGGLNIYGTGNHPGLPSLQLTRFGRCGQAA
jgi:hypothetical protein